MDINEAYAAAWAGTDKPDYMETTLDGLRSMLVKVPTDREDVAEFIRQSKDWDPDLVVAITKESIWVPVDKFGHPYSFR